MADCLNCGLGFAARPKMLYCSEACRFWAKVDRSAGQNACWPWTGARSHSGLGYGVFRLERQRKMVHSSRKAYELITGRAPGALMVCHSCDNPVCCNPGHLFLGTMSDNARDMRAKGRHILSAEAIERIRQSKLGKPASPETRARMSAARRARDALLP